MLLSSLLLLLYNGLFAFAHITVTVCFQICKPAVGEVGRIGDDFAVSSMQLLHIYPAVDHERTIEFQIFLTGGLKYCIYCILICFLLKNLLIAHLL